MKKEYKLLTPEIMDQLYNEALNIEIDTNELDSYQFHKGSSPLSYYGPEPDSEEWDEDEELQAQMRELAKEIDNGNIGEYININEDDFATSKEFDDYYEELSKESSEWLNDYADSLY